MTMYRYPKTFLQFFTHGQISLCSIMYSQKHSEYPAIIIIIIIIKEHIKESQASNVAKANLPNECTGRSLIL